ncbi:MAG: DUF188 domain-containing protein [Sphaerochaetaceae bacterium]
MQRDEHIQIWIDSDSCPKNVRKVVLRSLTKNNLSAVFVADRHLVDVETEIAEHTGLLRKAFIENGGSLEKSKEVKSKIEMVVVETEDDGADNYMVENSESPALAITRDLTLSYRLVSKGVTVIDDRGRLSSQENIKHKLSAKLVNDSFREWNLFFEQNKSLGAKQLREFSGSYDRLIHDMFL